MTGGGKIINKNKQYVKDYIDQYGENKVEANAVLFHDNEANADLEKVILGYLGDDPLSNFEKGKQKTQDDVEFFINNLGIPEQIEKWRQELKNLELEG